MSSQARREQVALACERGHSKRRACELMEIARSGLAYRSVRTERDAPTLEAMKRLAAQYPRYGYRRIRVFLRREPAGLLYGRIRLELFKTLSGRGEGCSRFGHVSRQRAEADMTAGDG